MGGLRRGRHSRRDASAVSGQFSATNWLTKRRRLGKWSAPVTDRAAAVGNICETRGDSIETVDVAVHGMLSPRRRAARGRERHEPVDITGDGRLDWRHAAEHRAPIRRHDLTPRFRQISFISRAISARRPIRFARPRATSQRRLAPLSQLVRRKSSSALHRAAMSPTSSRRRLRCGGRILIPTRTDFFGTLWNGKGPGTFISEVGLDSALQIGRRGSQSPRPSGNVG